MLAARHGTTVALCPLPVGVSRIGRRTVRDCAAAAVWRMASLLWVRFGVGLRMRLRELGLGLLASRMARRLFRRDTRLTDCTASSGPVGTVDGSSAAASVTGCVAPSIVCWRRNRDRATATECRNESGETDGARRRRRQTVQICRQRVAKRRGETVTARQPNGSGSDAAAAAAARLGSGRGCRRATGWRHGRSERDCRDLQVAAKP